MEDAILRLRDAVENLNAAYLRVTNRAAVVEVGESFAELTEQAVALAAIRECLVSAGFGTQEKPPTHVQCVGLVRMLTRSTLESGAPWTRTLQAWPEPETDVLAVWGDRHGARVVYVHTDQKRWMIDDREVRSPTWWRPLPVLP